MQAVSSASREIHMEQGPITRTLLLFTAPVLLSQILQQLYNITDCMIVGRFCGNYGLAAAGLSGLVLSVVVNFFIGFSTGVSVMISQAFGARSYAELKKIICTVVNLGLLIGALMMAMGILAAGSILNLLHCPPEVFEAAALYLVICFAGMIPQLVYNIGNAILRALGDTRTSLEYLLFSSLLNLVLDLLLAVILHMGLAGAALATVISQWFLLALMLYRLCRLDSRYAYRLRSEMLSLGELRHLVGISLPSGMQAIFMSISSLVLQVSINSFGAAAVAGLTVYAKVEGFVYYPAFAYGIALTGFVGQNYGARCMQRVDESIRISLRLAVSIIGPLSLLLVYFSHPLLSWFTSDPDIIRNGMQAILWNIPVYFLYAINQVYLGALKGLGKTTFPMICTLVCYCMFRVLWCQLLIPIFHSMIVVYTSYDVSWVIMIAMLLPVYRRTLREKEQYCLLHAA